MHHRASRESTAPADLSAAQMADRVALLLAGFDAVSTPRQARESAEALAQTLVGLYGKGLERVLDIVYDAAGDRADHIFTQLVADPFVESLLCLHGLHPIALADRVAAALDSIRPYLNSHEGDVEIVGIENDVVHLRLEGSCDGCASSATTLKLAVERAILERVPEIHEVRAVGGTAGNSRSNGHPTPTGHPTLKLESEWISLDDLPGLDAEPDAGLAVREVSGTPIVFVRFGRTVYAYRNACPRCASRLEDARLARPFLTCVACGAAFDVVHAGRSGDAVGASAIPFPLVNENGRVRVAIPLEV